MMDCKKERNLKACNCSYSSCSRKGVCCECIAYHRARKELPACFFDARSEKTYNRSIDFFIELRK